MLLSALYGRTPTTTPNERTRLTTRLTHLRHTSDPSSDTDHGHPVRAYGPIDNRSLPAQSSRSTRPSPYGSVTPQQQDLRLPARWPHPMRTRNRPRNHFGSSSATSSAPNVAIAIDCHMRGYRSSHCGTASPPTKPPLDNPVGHTPWAIANAVGDRF